MAQPMPDAKPAAPRPEPKMAEAERVPSMTQSQFDLTAEHRARTLEPVGPGVEEASPPPPERPLVEAPDIAPAPPKGAASAEAEPAPEPESVAAAEPEAEPVAVVPAAPAPSAPDPAAGSSTYPRTLKLTYVAVDKGWHQFFAMASAFPSERMDERLGEDGEGWSRKQMLAHIGAWHDEAHERLADLINTGEPSSRQVDTDVFNARVARIAVGRTAGEVLKDLEATFNRLRRQLGRLSDQMLVANDNWAAEIIASNTYEHYQEHAADVYQPPAPEKQGRR
jgi:hypothetical protein